VSLSEQLDEITTKLHALVPAERLTIIDESVEKLNNTGMVEQALKRGDTAPGFELEDGDGMRWRSEDLLRSGPLVVVFYRGRWCAYCNTQLAALQHIHPQIAAAGASLVAISPQTQKHTYMTRDTHTLRFPVLSDPGNAVARKFGLVWRLPPDLQQMYEGIMTKLPRYNGEGSWELPMPATYIVQPNRIISFARVDADWRRRPEPQDIVSQLPFQIHHRGHGESQRL
jgi:peroxiredoxin